MVKKKINWALVIFLIFGFILFCLIIRNMFMTLDLSSFASWFIIGFIGYIAGYIGYTILKMTRII